MSETELRELVVFSLEPWDNVWRRNQHFVDILLERNPALRVLFVEPPVDPLHSIRLRMVPQVPRTRRISADGRLRALRPLKLMPRRLGSLGDRLQLDQVRVAMRLMGFSWPVLWLNDPTYAPLIERTGYPSLYDMTDDWLLGPFPQREIERLRRLEETIFDCADEIVVCSPGLLESRSGRRPVELIPNGVDVAHFTVQQTRPADLPPPPVAVYVGSLHESRLDVDLVLDLADSVAELSVVLVGPDSLNHTAHARLRTNTRINLIGARSYQNVPAYLQHADVIIVPHVVSPFTESLDPVKAYECLAVGRPTVATPVAGFRELRDRVAVESREGFVNAVKQALVTDTARHSSDAIPSWVARAEAFEAIVRRASRARRPPTVLASTPAPRRVVAKQRAKQTVRRLIGEPYVGKRLKMRRLNRVLPSLHLDPLAILDAGTEDATFVYWLADRYPSSTVVAVDIDAEAIAACLATRPSTYADRVRFEVGTFSELESDSFDLVVAFDVLEHIEDDAGAVSNLARSLRPGGTLMVHVPRDKWTTWSGEVHRVADDEAWRINPGHVRQGYSPEQLERLLDEAGLTVKETQTWVGRWGALAHGVYSRFEHPTALRLLSIPVTDLCAWLDFRFSHDGNTVYCRATKGQVRG